MESTLDPTHWGWKMVSNRYEPIMTDEVSEAPHVLNASFHVMCWLIYSIVFTKEILIKEIVLTNM